MSKVYVHSPSETSFIKGFERHYAAYILSHLALAILLPERPFGDDVSWRKIRSALRPEPTYVTSEAELRMALRTRPHELSFVLPDGSTHGALGVLLNTCVDLGNEPLCLLARVHGQSEIHAYVEGSDRAWFADVIERGLSLHHTLRPGHGWEEVMAHALRSSEEPMVMSYSVTAWFPNAAMCGMEEPFTELERREQWALCMTKLRDTFGVRISPGTLTTQGFGMGINAFQILAALT